MIKLGVFLIAFTIFRYSSQSYFKDGLIEEACLKNCRCTHEENSSKVLIAHCTVDTNDEILQCNVEWPVLWITIKKMRFNANLLFSCRRTKRLMITMSSALVVLMPEMFQYSSELEGLTVQAPIQTIEMQFLKYLRKLKQLDVSETHLEHLSKSMFLDCPVTDRIRFSSNRISTVGDRTFENCVKLVTLDLSNNKIKVVNYLTFNNGYSLEILDLSKNSISKIDDFSFKNLRNLRILNLNDNLLKTINRDVFGDLRTLGDLLLESNLIETIDDKAFSDLKSIRSINLQKNRLSKLDLVLFLHLANLNLSLSEIECVREQTTDHLQVSPDVSSEFKKYPLCSGTRETPVNKQELVQKTTGSSKSDYAVTAKWKISGISASNIFELYPYLFPMVFGGLSVLLISIIIIAVVCHVKNKQINELRLQEIHLPMMQSTL